MGKSGRKRQRKRRPQGHPAQRAPRERRPAAELELERATAEIKRRAQEAHSPDTSPERVAAILVEDFGDLPAPVGFAQALRETGSSERAGAVAAEAQRLAPGSVTALTIAAEVARTVEGDRDRARALLDEALNAQVDPDGRAELARHLLEDERPIDALALLEEHLTDEPEDEEAQEARAGVLEGIHRRRRAGEKLERDEEEALARFSDRDLFYRLREAMGEYVEARPDLQQAIAVNVRMWLEELREAEEDGGAGGFELENTDADGPEDRIEGILRLAIEHAWLLGDEDEDEDVDDGDELGFEPAPELEESGAPIAQLATDPDTLPALAGAALRWLRSCCYGLWQLSDPVCAPGVWLTEIVSGVRRYAAIPPEQLEGASRWSVLVGALVAIDGTWRSTGALVQLRPAEADWAAELAREATVDIAKALTGKRVRRRRQRRQAPEPLGVLAGRAEPAPLEIALLMSQVIGNLIPTIAGEVWRRRAAGPTLNNTEGHRLRIITALLNVKDGTAAAERLTAHPDFETEEGGKLSWWGRELTEMERQSALAHLRSQLAADGEEPLEDPDEVPRWLRGRLDLRAGGFEVEVNSEERLEALLGLLHELGLEPELERRSVIDPAQDMPAIQTGGPIPFGASQEAIDAWLSYWPEERVPALGGLTPRAAAKRTQQRVRLEALLREFEHDAHLLARQRRPAPDIGRLRTELGMVRWWE